MIMIEETQPQQPQQVTFSFRHAFSSLLIRMIPVLRHKREAEILTARIAKMTEAFDKEREMYEARQQDAGDYSEHLHFKYDVLQERVTELEAFEAEVLAERKIVRFAVRQDEDRAFRVYSHQCPTCEIHYGGFTFRWFEEARQAVEYLNQAAPCGVQSVVCPACSASSQEGGDCA